MNLDQDQSLREHLRELLTKGHAHATFEHAIEGLPVEVRGASHPLVPHTPWRLLEHMRIAQWDILQFCIDPGHVSPDFPDGYWPDSDAPPDPDPWDRTVSNFQADLQAMLDLVSNPETDLFARLPHGDGQTVLREAMLVADHNAYHLGQLIVVRRLLGAWDD